MSEDLPYSAEYAKSGRSACKTCGSSIPKDHIRVARLVQSPHFDGKMALWNHFNCFFRYCTCIKWIYTVYTQIIIHVCAIYLRLNVAIQCLLYAEKKGISQQWCNYITPLLLVHGWTKCTLYSMMQWECQTLKNDESWRRKSLNMSLWIHEC